MEKRFFVYLMASQPNGTLYVGVTSDLIKRAWQHRTGTVEGFSKKYRVHRLVYFEKQPDALSAILREKQIKKWFRELKVRLIEETNPAWRDLWEDILD